MDYKIKLYFLFLSYILVYSASSANIYHLPTELKLI